MAKNLEARMRASENSVNGSFTPSQGGRVRQEAPREVPPTPAQQQPRPKTILELIEDGRDSFYSVLPRGYDVDQFVLDAITYVKNNPEIRSCTNMSILGAFMSCAQLGLRPGVMGQAYIRRTWSSVKQNYEATFLIGYRGLVELAYRSPDVASIVSRVAYERDDFEISYGLHEDIVHRPYMLGDRGKPIAYYCIIRLRNGGSPMFTVMSQAEMQDFHLKYGSLDPASPWMRDFEAMAMKTVLRQLSKWMPKSTAFSVGLAVDNSVRNSLSGDIVHASIPVSAITSAPEPNKEEQPQQSHQEDTQDDSDMSEIKSLSATNNFFATLFQQPPVAENPNPPTKQEVENKLEYTPEHTPEDTMEDTVDTVMEDNREDTTEHNVDNTPEGMVEDSPEGNGGHETDTHTPHDAQETNGQNTPVASQQPTLFLGPEIYDDRGYAEDFYGSVPEDEIPF